MTDVNNITLCGTIGWSKYYPPENKAYSMLSLRINLTELTREVAFITVNVGEKDIARKTPEKIIEHLERSLKKCVFISDATIGQQPGKDKTGKEIIKDIIKCSINNVVPVPDSQYKQINSVNVKGIIKEVNENFIVISTSYYSVKNGWNYRNVSVLPTDNINLYKNGAGIACSGKLMSKFNNREILHVQSDSIVLFSGAEEREYSNNRKTDIQFG